MCRKSYDCAPAKQGNDKSFLNETVAMLWVCGIRP